MFKMDYKICKNKVRAEKEKTYLNTLFEMDIIEANFLYDNIIKRPWLMLNGEKVAVQYLLNKIKPQISIEIGTFQGGCLDAISKHSEFVYSLDIDHTLVENSDEYNNVEFITGDSHASLPKIIHNLNDDNRTLEFVLIDGDHTELGVKTDIESVLLYKPKKPLFILMHDSFNPYTRKGILHASWNASPFVHYVDLDFVHGRLIEDSRKMWGGLALAILLPNKRIDKLAIKQNNLATFNAVSKHSVHFSLFVKYRKKIQKSLSKRFKKYIFQN